MATIAKEGREKRNIQKQCPSKKVKAETNHATSSLKVTTYFVATEHLLSYIKANFANFERKKQQWSELLQTITEKMQCSA